MNCWFWIILLWCFWGNGGSRSNCMCTCDCDRDRDRDSSCCDPVFPTPVVPPCAPPNSGCGCGNEMPQSRGFAGFGDNNTCGCEEKEDKK